MDSVKNLQAIIQANRRGLLGDSFLIKARTSFDEQTGYVPTKEDLIAKSVTFKKFLNNEEQDLELCKALREGETKVKNGVVYVVKKTKGGNLDWRKANVNKKKKSDDDEDEDFPKDLDDLEFVSNLGGSTGAKLMKDKNTGEKFVLKKGNSPEHVQEEFLANQIYELFGVNVPMVKLYGEGTKDASMLSRYMENTEVANNILDDKLKKEIMNNYVVDCLLANWDIYKNDNILINKDDGLVYRVDNGGSLRFSAQGRDKAEHFSDSVDELDSMIGQNVLMTSGLTQQDLEEQIKFVLKQQKHVLALISDNDLKSKMKKRFLDLRMRLSDFDDSDKDPSRELTEKELEKALKKSGGHIMNTNSETGWTFLSEICKMRKFDGLPEVLEDDDFDALLEKQENRLLQRGLTGDRGETAQKFMKDFVENENCFYGTVGMYGAGIYAALNKTKKNPPPPNPDYEIAHQYSDYNKDQILDIILPSDAKVIYADKLDEMMNEEFFGEEFKEKKTEYDEARKEYDEKENYAQNIEKIIEQETRKEMGWDEKALNALNSRPEIYFADPNQKSFQRAVTYYSSIVKRIGGNITKVGSSYEISLPLSQETFTMNLKVAERSSNKQKNVASPSYNLHYRYLRNFLIDNHFKKINEKTIEIQKDDERISKAHEDAKEAKAKLSVISDEINKIRSSGNSTIGDVMSKIAKSPNGEHRGFYAAIKGYDAIIQRNGWGGQY